MGIADLRVEEPPSSSRAVHEMADGLTFWDSRRGWGKDLGNANYEAWAKENPHGEFSLEWWKPFLGRLNRWKATRGWDNGTVLTSRFVACMAELSRAWTEVCEPFLDDDISSVTWEQVSAFPILVATIKPTRSHSPVFASKFCHFLLPRVFPVVDNEGLGNRWSTYQRYFQCVQDEWAATEPADRTALRALLTERIKATGATVFHGYPFINKVVELRLIGRQHPGTDSQTASSR
jgi:hypothetical protein